MKMLDSIYREKSLELFGKFIRTKNIESFQSEQPRTGPQHDTAGSKQKLQVRTFELFISLFFFTSK